MIIYKFILIFVVVILSEFLRLVKRLILVVLWFDFIDDEKIISEVKRKVWMVIVEFDFFRRGIIK